MHKSFLSILLALCCQYGLAQKITELTNKPGISIRGLSVLDNDHAWASGTKGAIAQTDDGGKNWHWFQVPGYENRDFRDIEVLDSNTAVVMAIDTPAVLLRTTDKGRHWEKVMEDTRPGMFLDAMDFDGKNAIVVGDPLDGKIYLAKSKDYGKSWQPIRKAFPSQGGCFASSGTNIVWRNGDYLTVTGGWESFLYWHGHVLALPLTKGKETTGANSIAVNPDPKANISAVVVGGNFNDKERSDSNCVLVQRTFFQTPNTNSLAQPAQQPKGYKSCVMYMDRQTLIATGTSGTDISVDQGSHWTHFSDQPFHVVQKAKNGNLVLLAGPNGTIAALDL
ncbi:MAG: YCF48-related protein [Chitinophagaceae bacterium]